MPTPKTADEAAKLCQSPEFHSAWTTLADSGPAGLAALKKAVAGKSPKNGPFKLAAGSLLWRLGQLDECADVAQLWSEGHLPPFGSPIIHATAYAAARTHDPRALPLVFVALRDTDAVVDVPKANMTLMWPETAEFVWGAYGPSGRAALLREMRESNDPDFQATAAWLLARSGAFEALPEIRRLARNGTGLSRPMAIRALGILGHPEDFDFLEKGLQSAVRTETKNRMELDMGEAWIDAIAEYGDLRGAHELLKYARTSTNPALRERARVLMVNLLTPETLAFLQTEAGTLTGTERERFNAGLAHLFEAMDTTPEAYGTLLPDEREAVIGHLRERIQDAYTPRPSLPLMAKGHLQDHLKRAQEGLLVPAAGNRDAALLPRQVLANSSLDDINALLQMQESVAGRLTPAALQDMDVLSAMMVRVARSHYREDPGICAKVEPKR